ncbi:DUF4231 domain-containing protein [Nocardia sp. NBC_00565]|uniref:DUF4231 domain-containing protein n=1 Tax=Nocardia sp. NBC_00565 TaxID=2975993 RepID=UPI002E80E0E3|nr:DUF4231 domain-containing protein [Nocardia sp. NBC_00565]WUC03455.1 DUF4231 domain-containing protein [Nocardia sp. NBC_00565]
MAETDPVWERLTEQLQWYSSKGAAAQRTYKRVKFAQIAVGASVPVVAALSAPAAVTATIAAAVVVAEGAQQLFQWHTSWLQYRSTAESLKHEKYLYLAQSGPYRANDRRALLAERVEALTSSEHTTWMTEHQRHSEPAASP